jgi:hypothetical protein
LGRNCRKFEKHRDASARLKARAIDVEKSRPGARREMRSCGKEPMGLKTTPEAPATSADKPAPAEDHAAAPPSEPRRPAPPAASVSDLPSIAAKDEEFEAIKKTVEDAAAVSGGLWLSYLFVLFYLAVAAGAVTHADLFLENPVKLPFLNVELPLLAFFSWRRSCS